MSPNPPSANVLVAAALLGSASLSISQAPAIRTTTHYGMRVSDGQTPRNTGWAQSTTFTSQQRLMIEAGSLRSTGDGILGDLLIMPDQEDIFGLTFHGFYVQETMFAQRYQSPRVLSGETTASASGPAAPHAMEAAYAIPQGRSALVWIDAGASTWSSTCTVKLEIRAGGTPRTITLNGTDSVQDFFDVSVTGSSGVVVSVEVQSRLSLPATESSEQVSTWARVLLLPTSGGLRCQATGYGQPCNRLGTLSIRERPLGGGASLLDFAVTGALPGNLMFLMIGTRRTSIPLPPSPCNLLTDGLAMVPMYAGSNGSASMMVVAPAGSYLFTTQLLGMDVPIRDFATSNALEARCQ